jgi:hypothetical protein
MVVRQFGVRTLTDLRGLTAGNGELVGIGGHLVYHRVNEAHLVQYRARQYEWVEIVAPH